MLRIVSNDPSTLLLFPVIASVARQSLLAAESSAEDCLPKV